MVQGLGWRAFLAKASRCAYFSKVRNSQATPQQLPNSAESLEDFT